VIQRRRRSRKILAAQVLLLGGVAAVIAYAAAQQLGPSSKSRSAGSLGIERSPIGGGTQVTLQEAQADVSYLLVMPNSTAADASNVSEVWAEPEYQEIGIVFDSGSGRIVLDLYPYTLTDPKGAYQDEIDLGVAKSTLTNVNGIPAIVTEPGSDVPGTNPAWVRFHLDTVDVNLFSQDVGTDELLGIAATIAPFDVSSPSPTPSSVSPSIQASQSPS
jgi:hypothetical protein